MWTIGNTRLTAGRRAIPARERVLAIAIDSDAVTVLDVTRAGESLDVHSLGHWNWPPVDAAAPHQESSGAWLWTQLNTLGILPRPVLLVLPRQAAVLKLIEIPAVPSEELAAAVQLQAESTLSRPLEEQSLDFVTTGQREHALLVSVPRETLEAAQCLLHAAGLTVTAATIGELNLIHRSPASQPEGTQLAVFADASHAELTLSWSGTPLASLAVRFTSSEDADRLLSIAATVSRLRASLPTMFSQSEVQSVALFGATAEALIHSGAQIGCSQAALVRSQALTHSHDAEREWPVLAMSVRSRAHADQSIDLLHPRRPPDATIAPRRRRWRIVAAVAALLGCVAFLLFFYSRSLDGQIVQLQERDRELKSLIQRGQPLLEAAEFVGEWRQGQIDWPQELTRFVECLPPRDRAYLTQLSFDVPLDSNAPVIRVNGQAKSVQDVLQLHQRLLAEDSGYELRPHGIEPSTRDVDYPATFDVEAAIQPLSVTSTPSTSGKP